MLGDGVVHDGIEDRQARIERSLREGGNIECHWKEDGEEQNFRQTFHVAVTVHDRGDIAQD